MSIEDLVPDFETCEEAKKLGFPQDTQFYHKVERMYIPTVHKDLVDLDGDVTVAAPIVQESIKIIVDALHEANANYDIEVLRPIASYDEYKINCYNVLNSKNVYAMEHWNPSQSLLELWIKLKKDGIII